MSVRIHVCVDIDAPVALVWDVVEPVERHVDWMADAEAIRFTTERRRGVGTAFECDTRVGPLRLTDVMTVTEWEPRRAMGIVHEGIVTGTGRFTLRAVPGGRGPGGHEGTEFCWTEVLTFPWWMGGPVGERVGAPVLKAIWRRNLQRLQAECERRAREPGSVPGASG